MRKIVMFDVDGVLADFVLGFTTLGQKMGFPIRPYGTLEQPSWDFQPLVTVAQENAMWEKLKADDLWWTTLQPLIDKDTFNKIDDMQLRHDLYFVTSRPGVYVKSQTEHWLERFGIRRPTVILSKRKGDVAAGLQATHAIDDKAGNAVYIGYHSPKTQSFLLDRPYNRYDQTVVGSRVKRIATLQEFMEAVDA